VSTEQNALEMSDEDILNMAPPSDEEPVIEDVTEEEESNEEEETSSEETSDDSSEQEEEEESELSPDEIAQAAFQAAAAKSAGIDEEEELEASEEEPDDQTARKRDKSGKFVKGSKDDKEAEIADLNYQTEYEKLLAPFRANGKDMQVGNVDDALTLMKMGANYNKKMAGLKPNLKLMKMLSNNDLLDEEKLTYLIDLQKKNPEAIAKFIKDSGIDPLDIDTEKDTEYKPGTYTVNDKDVELDMVLEGIQDTKSFDETIDIIGNKWDDSSKRVVLEDPKLIEVINEHVASGIYDQIHKIVESEKMLGRLTELSDLEAYKHVGDVLQKEGAFDTVGSNTTEQQSQPSQKQAPTKAIRSEDPKLKNRRRAASSPRGSSKTKAPQFDPLAMSDEEFEKVSASIGM